METYGCSLSISGSLKWVITPSCTLSVAESATGKTWDQQCQNVTDNPASGTVTGTSSDGVTLKLSGTAWTGSEVITATVSGNSISANVTAKSADNGNESFTYSLTKQ